MSAVEKGIYKKQVKHECTYHAPKTEEQRNNHERVNAAVLKLLNELIDICPLSPQLEEAVSFIKIGRNKANEALAVHVNAKTPKSIGDKEVKEIQKKKQHLEQQGKIR